MMSENLQIFEGLTAWFSESVSTERKTKWSEYKQYNFHKYEGHYTINVTD